MGWLSGKSFDDQFDDSKRRAEAKRKKGEYPYDVDKKLADGGKVKRKDRRKKKES